MGAESSICQSAEISCRGTLIEGICLGDIREDRLLETDELVAEFLISDRIAEINTPISFILRITNKESTTKQIFLGDCENKPLDSICIEVPFFTETSCDSLTGKEKQCIVSKNISSSIDSGQTLDAIITMKFFEPYNGALTSNVKLPYTIPSVNSNFMRNYYSIITNLRLLKSSLIVYDPNLADNGLCGNTILPQEVFDEGKCCNEIFYPAIDDCNIDEFISAHNKAEPNDPTEFIFFDGLIFDRKTDREYKEQIGNQRVGVFFAYDQTYFESDGENLPMFSSLQEIKDYQEEVFSGVNDWLDKESIKYLGYDAIDYNYEPFYIEINKSEYPSGVTYEAPAITLILEKLIHEIEQKAGVAMDNYDYVVFYLPSEIQTYLHGGGTGANAYVKKLYPVYSDLWAFFLKSTEIFDPKQNHRVLVHESFHPFGARDIYGGGEGTSNKDYSFKFFNCIMGNGGFNEKIGHFSVCDYTAAEIGWMDLDCDGIPEALESNPVLYTEKIQDLSRFTSIEPLWSALLEKNDGIQMTISLIKFEWLNYQNQGEHVAMFYLKDGVNEYLSDKDEPGSDAREYVNTCDSSDVYDTCIGLCPNTEPDRENCVDQCSQDFTCQSQITCLAYAPDNTCGVKKLVPVFGSDKLELNFIPDSGQLSSGSYNGQSIILINQNGFVSLGNLS